MSGEKNEKSSKEEFLACVENMKTWRAKGEGFYYYVGGMLLNYEGFEKILADHDPKLAAKFRVFVEVAEDIAADAKQPR